MPNPDYQSMVSGAKRGAARSPAAMRWFKAQVVRLFKSPGSADDPVRIPGVKGPRAAAVVKPITRIRSSSIGKMYTYMYDPKHKQRLPYYDTFPLIFVVNVYRDGFLGINLHYLPPMLRAILMDGLSEIANNDRYNDTTKLKLSYAELTSRSNLKYYKPCVKRYLTAHVMSTYIEIPPREWIMGVFMDTQRFVGASADKVWADSRESVDR